MKKLLLVALLTVSFHSLGQDDLFYNCEDGTTAHMHMDKNQKAVMDFHWHTLRYNGMDAIHEPRFVDKSYMLRMRPLTDKEFIMDMQSETTRFATSCEEVRQSHP